MLLTFVDGMQINEFSMHLNRVGREAIPLEDIYATYSPKIEMWGRGRG